MVKNAIAKMNGSYKVCSLMQFIIFFYATESIIDGLSLKTNVVFGCDPQKKHKIVGSDHFWNQMSVLEEVLWTQLGEVSAKNWQVQQTKLFNIFQTVTEHIC